MDNITELIKHNMNYNEFTDFNDIVSPVVGESINRRDPFNILILKKWN